MTDEQIIKALECCKSGTTDDCKCCPRLDGDRDLSTEDCMEKLMHDALALINRQKETIEQLQTALFKCGEELAEMQKTEGKANVKFKTGDSAKIVDNNSGHQFKIGTIVMLEKHKDDYKAYANGNYWWVTDDDLAEIDNDDLVKEFTEGADGNQSL